MMLRALIVLLLCMNLGVAVWWAAHREPTRPELPATDAGIPSLTLLSETERPAAAVDAAELSVAPEAPGPASTCLSLGPFSTPADLRKAMNTLMPQVESIQFREVAAVSLRGYRVFLPAAGSRAQALETARALSAKGISDYYVVTAGEQQDTISLGIFRELENATKRREEVAALGYNPTTEARTEPVQQWWIDLVAPPDFDWQAALPGTGLKSVSTPCSPAPPSP
jgi:hypothetical protein